MTDFAKTASLPGFTPEEADEIRKRALGDQWHSAMRIARMHAVVFDTEAGQALMQHLIRTFLCRAIVRPGEDAFAQGIREGQANVIRQILAQIEFARGEPPEGVKP
jgi:hypothetical protein